MYEHMSTLAIPLDIEQRASSTTHAVVDDYAERTYARDDIPPPPAPEAIIPLCHTLAGPPPDFCILPDRRMPWSPLAMHDPSTRAIIGWVHQWVCNTCSATITEHDAQPASTQGACTACNSWLGWVIECQGGEGQWRCTQPQCAASHDAYVAPVPVLLDLLPADLSNGVEAMPEHRQVIGASEAIVPSTLPAPVSFAWSPPLLPGATRVNSWI